MKQKYTLIEGNDALNKTLLMMRYDVSKTLNENINVVEITYINEGITIDASTISELLLDAREYLFTTGGMTAQIVLSILGAEIGAPIAFAILDIAIIINDFSIMVKNWKDTEYTPWTWEWFTFHWENNKGFQMVIEDLGLLLGMGLTRLVGKGSKYAWKHLKSMSKNSEKLVLLAEKEILKKEPFIKKLPNYEELVAGARETLGKQGISLPENTISFESKQTGTPAWFRRMMEAVK
jgi:hypothetical protein